MLKEILDLLKEGKIDSLDAENMLVKYLNENKSRDDSSLEVKEDDSFQKDEIKEDILRFEDIDDYIALITIQDKKNKNVITKEMIYELMQSFEKVKNNKKYKVVIITGYDNYFCCGGSKDLLLELYNGQGKMTDVSLCKEILNCEVPVIAAMQGHSIGGGWCLGMFCDFPIMSLESRYTCNHIKYGFTPGDGATLVFKEKLGEAISLEVLFTAKTYKGFDLKSKGAQYPIVPRKKVLEYALDLAKNFKDTPRETLTLLKNHMNMTILDKLDDVLEREWDMQQKTFVNKPDVLERILSTFNSPVSNKNLEKKVSANKTAESEINQVIKLNDKFDGKPVFWIHGEGGGVEAYQMIAKFSDRPFYGIEAKGRRKIGNFSYKLEEIVDEYIEIIKSIQPKGSYDLGGFSLGGAIAYEICCKLQEMGETVKTITMIDSLDSASLKKFKFSSKSIILQNINMAIINRTKLKESNFSEVLIKNDEVNLELGDKEFLEEVIKLGQARGLSNKMSYKELASIFSRNIEIMKAINNINFRILPLKHPDETRCYYFVNKNKTLLGNLESYFSTNFDHIDNTCNSYFEEWRKNILNFNCIEVASSNHMTMLFENEIYKEISKVCRDIYSNDNGD